MSSFVHVDSDTSPKKFGYTSLFVSYFVVVRLPRDIFHAIFPFRRWPVSILKSSIDFKQPSFSFYPSNPSAQFPLGEKSSCLFSPEVSLLNPLGMRSRNRKIIRLCMLLCWLSSEINQLQQNRNLPSTDSIWFQSQISHRRLGIVSPLEEREGDICERINGVTSNLNQICQRHL